MCVCVCVCVCVFLRCLAKEWKRQWHPTPIPLPGKSHGWRSLVGCRLWGRTESDTTEVTEQQQQQHIKGQQTSLQAKSDLLPIFVNRVLLCIGNSDAPYLGGCGYDYVTD